MMDALKIIEDWENQARERDARDPMRAQILEEAAVLRASIASARAQAMEEAAGVVLSCTWGYYWTLDGVPSDPTDIAAAIRALSPTPDTTTPVIEAAKAVVAEDNRITAGDAPEGSHFSRLMDALAAALAAHEARHAF